MDLNACISLMQGYLENNPLIVLGSGASIPYGIPSMEELAKRLTENDIIKADDSYDDFCTALKEMGLEKAVDEVSLQEVTGKAIRTTIWEIINSCDQSFLKSNAFAAPTALMLLLKKVIAPTPNKAVIVTTNYDRLSEYAADGIGATTVTGFEGTLLRKLDIPNASVNLKRIRARERTINIWKVHGSLDWFKSPTGEIVALPFSRSIPEGFTPLIVPPGKDKYSSTHNEPYRSIISEADKAFIQAGSYFCVGYGFNDEHVQPKLLAQIEKEKPIVILARTMTEACKQCIVKSGIKKYLIFEKKDDLHTSVYGNGWTEVFEGQYWQLEEFLKVW